MKSLEYQGGVALPLIPLGFSLVVAGIVLDSSVPAKFPLIEEIL